MSLKTFHLVFITISCLMGLGLGVWGLRHHLAVANNVHLGLGVSGFLLAAGLIAYETWFLGKKGPLSVAESQESKSS